MSARTAFEKDRIESQQMQFIISQANARAYATWTESREQAHERQLQDRIREANDRVRVAEDNARAANDRLEQARADVHPLERDN